MKFSIIVNFRNQPVEVVARCISSILHQAHKDFEILCCDDCSDDKDSYLYLMGLASQNEKVIVRRNSERRWGLLNALDSFDMAEGDILMQVDGDDYLANEYALSIIHDQYEAGHDCTWGSCRTEPGPNVGQEVRLATPLRMYGPRFSASSPRTFLRSLYRAAVARWGREAFTLDMGLPSVANDIRVFYPILKLAKHRKPIYDILYIYKQTVPPNDPDIDPMRVIEHVESLP